LVLLRVEEKKKRKRQQQKRQDIEMRFAT